MTHPRIALITGANQGVGRHVAKELAAHGVTALVGSRDLAKGKAAAQEIGPGAMALQLDVTDRASIAAAAERIRAEFGRLDLLVNNAAISNTRKQALGLTCGSASGRSPAPGPPKHPPRFPTREGAGEDTVSADADGAGTAADAVGVRGMTRNSPSATGFIVARLAPISSKSWVKMSPAAVVTERSAASNLPHFPPVVAMPSMNARCARKNITITGSTTSVDAAMSWC